MEFNASQIAAMLGGTIEGDPNATIRSFGKIEEASTGDITFLSNPKYTHFIYKTGASAVLVRRDFKAEEPVKATLIRVDDPYNALAQLLTMANKALNPPKRGIEQPSYIAPDVKVPEDAYIGAFAYIGTGTQLGAGVQIYPQTYVGDGCKIGAETTLYPGVKVYRGCEIGNRCILHSGVVVGGDGFGFAPVGEEYHKIPQLGNVVIADDVEIGANTTVDRAVMGSTVIEKGVKLDNLIQIAHNCTVGANTVMASQVGLAGSAHIGRHCVIGGQAGIVGHNKIGDNVAIGPQSGVAGSVAEGSRIMGSPALNFRDYARIQAALKHLPEMVLNHKKKD